MLSALLAAGVFVAKVALSLLALSIAGVAFVFAMMARTERRERRAAQAVVAQAVMAVDAGGPNGDESAGVVVKRGKDGRLYCFRIELAVLALLVGVGVGACAARQPVEARCEPRPFVEGGDEFWIPADCMDMERRK